MRYDTILWDFNGTLVDDAALACAAVNDSLARRGLPPLTLERYRACVDTPIVRFYEQVFDLSTVSFETLASEFHTYYAAHAAQAPLAAGAAGLLAKLRGQGIRQWVVTASAQDDVCAALRTRGALAYFDAVLGAADRRAESKVERTLAHFRRQGLDPARAVVVGDCVHDFEVAQALGTACVLVSYGHQNADDLRRCGVPVVDTLAALKAYLL